MIKTILSNIKEYRKASIAAPLLMIGEVICELMLPYLMANIIDLGIYQNNMNAVVKNGLLMVLCAFLSLFFGTMSARTASYASSGLAKNLRYAMFKKIQNFSFKNTDKYNTSGLVTRLMTDVTNTQNSYQMILRLAVRAPMTLIVALFMAFSINADLSVIFVYAIIFLSVGLSVMMYFAFIYFRKVFEQYDALNASVQENITNIRVVKAYVKEKDETNKFKKASFNVYKSFIKAENIVVFNSPLMYLTIYACIIALSWFGANMIVNNALTTGELMSLFTYTMSILMSLMMISFIFVMISMSFASANRIAEILNEEIDIVSPENPVKKVSDGRITFKNVNFKYYDHSEDYVLENINLEIKSGETIGILGGTGSGKSTLVQLIPRLYDVKEGEVLVSGINVKEYDLKTLRDAVAMVLQKNVLFSGTIKENLKWGNEKASDEEIIRACKLAQADGFINSFPDGYDTYIEQGGTNVSGGQKQRLTIARALLKNPKILILDDSTSAVDTKTDALIRKAFREDIPNITKLIISQRISSIEDANRIIVLDNGRIEAVGTHWELIEKSPIYKEIYETQVKGGNENE